MTVIEREPDQITHEDEASHQEPPQDYAVLVLNDQTTPRLFVQEALSRCFQIFNDEARRIIEDAEKQDRTVVKVYPRDIAETKVSQANQFVRGFTHPLTQKPMELTFVCEPV